MFCRCFSFNFESTQTIDINRICTLCSDIWNSTVLTWTKKGHLIPNQWPACIIYRTHIYIYNKIYGVFIASTLFHSMLLFMRKIGSMTPFHSIPFELSRFSSFNSMPLYINGLYCKHIRTVSIVIGRLIQVIVTLNWNALSHIRCVCVLFQSHRYPITSRLKDFHTNALTNNVRHIHTTS